MTPVDAFTPWVEHRVAVDTPRANVQHSIREALTVFLRESRAAVDTAYVTQEACDAEVFIPVPPCRRLVGVEEIFQEPQNGGAPGRGVWTPRWPRLGQEETTAPHGYAALVNEHLWRHDMADGDRTTVWVAAPGKPRRLAVRYTWTLPRAGLQCEVPDWLFEDHADAIAAGALELMHRNPADIEATGPFGSLQDTLFRHAIHNARRRKMAAYGAGTFSTGAAHFFGG